MNVGDWVSKGDASGILEGFDGEFILVIADGFEDDGPIMWMPDWLINEQE